jgi:hypothetical protein
MNLISRVFSVSLIGMSTSVLACDPRQPEDFSAFFASFSGDKAFAVDRTIYPSLRVRYEYGIEEGKQQITEVKVRVSKQEDRKYPALGETMKSVGLESTAKEVSRTETVVEVFKPGTNGLVTYHFSLRRGCWFLREIQNHAL